MNYSDYITTDGKEIIANKETEFAYTGYLSGVSSKVYIRYGLNGWNNIEEQEMEKQGDKFVAKIAVPSDSKEINFSFRNEKRMWDNNYGNNYTFKVMPPEIVVDEEDELETSFFSDDFLLAYNLNKEIQKKQIVQQDEENVQEENNEVIGDAEPDNALYFVSDDGTVKRKEENLKYENLNTVKVDDITDEEIAKSAEAKLKEIRDKMFQKAKIYEVGEDNVLDMKLVEADERKKEQLTTDCVYFHSDIPYAKLFKESKVEHVQELIDKISEEENVTVFKPVRAYATSLRKIANENLLRLEMQKEDNNFLVVAPYSETVSIRARFRRIKEAVMSIFRKVSDVLSKRLGFQTSNA